SPPRSGSQPTPTPAPGSRWRASSWSAACSTSSPGVGPKRTVERKRAPGFPDAPLFERAVRSGAVIHVELDRARRGLPAELFFPLELHVGLDLVEREHVALEQELMVCGECFECFAQGAAHGRHFGELRRRQIVEVLVHRL